MYPTVLRDLVFLCSVGMLISKIIELIDGFFGLFLAFDRLCPSLVAILTPVLFPILYPTICHNSVGHKSRISLLPMVHFLPQACYFIPIGEHHAACLGKK